MLIYRMKLNFSLSFQFKELNQLLSACGADILPQVDDAKSVTLTQTLNIVPTKELIQKYEQAIKEHSSTETMECVSCRFTGYEYIWPEEIQE